MPERSRVADVVCAPSKYPIASVVIAIPGDDGANATLIAQLAPASSVEPQVALAPGYPFPPAYENGSGSVEPIAVAVAVPAFVIHKTWFVVVPLATVPKL